MNTRYTEITDVGFGISVEVSDVLFKDTSAFQEVSIIDTPALGKMLLLDNLVMTSEKDEFFYHEMISHIPLNSHKNPKTVLVIGGGDGGTVREVLKHPSVEEVILCEIDGMVVDVCKKYLPTIASKLDDKKVKVLIQDAIEYISTQKNRFDIILIDSTDPMGPGEGLFTQDFYNNVKSALKPGGIVCAQSESPFANQKEIKSMYKLLKKVFPIVETFVGPIPTYPAGYWSWAFASVDVKPLEFINEQNANEISKTSQLYNIDIHRSAFSLPNFVRKLVKEC